MDKAIKRRKGVEIHPIAAGVDAGADACRKNPTENEVIRTGKKVYSPPLSSTNKETKLSENLNDGMKCVFIDYGISLEQAKYPPPPRYDVLEFDVCPRS